MAALNLFNVAVLDLAKAVHQFHAAGHTFKVYLSDATPSASADALKADLAEITAAFGYPAGGTDVQNDATQTAGVLSVSGVTVVFTAAGGSFGPFRYVVLYNDTAASDPLFCWWDLGTEVIVADTGTFTIIFAGNVVFTLGLGG